MKKRQTLAILGLIVISGSMLIFHDWGCKSNDEPTNPGSGGNAKYGKGSMSFDAPEGGGHFSANGAYKPSAVFQSDTSSEGVGGFVYDTTIGGKPEQAVFAGYVQSLKKGVLNERLIVFTLHNTAGSLSTGDYALTNADTIMAGKSSYVYFLFSDSVHFYSTLEAQSGIFTLSTFDLGTHHAAGTFSGTLQGIPPDTTHLSITNGSFDLTFVTRYFTY